MNYFMFWWFKHSILSCIFNVLSDHKPGLLWSLIVDVESVEDTTSVHKIIAESCGNKMERTSVIKYNGYSEIDFQKITQKDMEDLDAFIQNNKHYI